MKYLEKYIFELIPNLCNLPNLPLEINDEPMADYFQLTMMERFHVNYFHKKQYHSFKIDLHNKYVNPINLYDYFVLQYYRPRFSSKYTFPRA